MIPVPFQYHRPSSLAEAIALLGRLDDARFLAGGHSLIPMMKLRLSRPSHLIDLGGVGELKGICFDGSEIVIGAMTTQHDLIASEALAERAPILREASQQIADPQVRYLGTLGGNVANGDPGNDMPALMLALDATYVVKGPNGERREAARDFYLGIYETTLQQGEVLAEIRIPVPARPHGWAYEKLKRKVGDYATAAAAVLMTVSGGRVATCAIGLTNVGDRPLHADNAAKAAIGTTLDGPSLKRAAEAAEAVAAPAEDGRGSKEYRTKMAGVMARRALERAFARATA